MDTSELNERVEHAESNWQNAQQGEPGNKTWGCFTYSDGPLAMGGGVGFFVWFSTRNEMLDFISETLPYEPPGPMRIDMDQIVSGTQSIIDAMKDTSIDDLTGIAALNEVLKGCSQIEWMGNLQELLTGDVPYPRQVRSAFRENNGSNNSEAPIQPEQEADFGSFLNEWGF